MADDRLLERAIQLRRDGQLERACELYRQVIDAGPPRADVLGSLGVVLGKLGRLPEAIACHEEALKLDPDSAELYSNLGGLLVHAGRLDEAERCYANALRVDPRSAHAHYNRGNLFEKRKQWDRAIACFRDALAIEPGLIEAQCALGNALRETGELTEARRWLESAAALRPDSLPVVNNLAAALQSMGRVDEAHRYLVRAVELAPRDPNAHLNLGIVLNELNAPAMAVRCYDRALELRPDFPQAQLSLGIALLDLGEFKRGWAGYEYRALCEQFDTPRHPQPRWDGAPLEGRTLLVQAEQGLGDTLQFIRYLPLVRQRGGRVLVAVQSALVPLLRTSGFENLVATDGPLPPFDVYAPLMSLPYVFGTTLETIPHDVPYLAVEDQRVERWRQHLRQYDGFKIGIVWQGRTDQGKGRLRTTPLAAFAPLARVPGVRLFSLQKNAGVEQLAALAADPQAPGYFDVVDLGRLHDNEGPVFQDTGAAMKCMDLVVTCDTGAAHLAGGLAVPIWVALHVGSEWRWMCDRTDSPWYPTMRLFRQSRLNDWTDVFERMAGELPHVIAAGQPPAPDALAPPPASHDPQLLERAIQLHRDGQLERACELYRQVIDAGPPRPDVLGMRGAALGKLGRLPEAIACYEEALRLDPGSAELHNSQGAQLADAGRLDEAERCYANALRIDPGCADAHYNRGNLFEKRKQWDRAIDSYREALAIQPDWVEAQCNLGIVLCHRGKFDEALRWLESADRLRPNFFPVVTNLGGALQSLGRLDEAHRYLARAVELAPRNPSAHLNLGVALNELNAPAMAVRCYDRALELRPDFIEAQFARGTALLKLGDLSRGWAGYEYRGQLEQFDTPRHRQPRWDGAPLEGRTLLVQSEQGLGDTLQFIRYLPLVRQRGSSVVVAVQPALVPLLRTSGFENLVAADGPLPPFDVYAPLMSLPHIFGTTLETIPHDVPYLAVEDQRVARWREHLRQYDGFKIGIVWQGKPVFHADRLRATHLAAFAPLARVPGVRLFSLQKNAGVEQLAALAADPQAPGYFDVVDLGRLHDNEGPVFQDTGATMKCMDLVVTCDTGAAHLAGGLAVPVWMALHLGSEWRWMCDRTDTPWYPTMRLFRQSRLNDWTDVFERMAGEVARVIASGQPPARDALIPPPVSQDPQLLERAIQLHRDGQLERACAMYRQILEVGAPRADVLSLLGTVLGQLGRIAEAIEYSARAAWLAPNVAMIHGRLGALLLHAGRLDEAAASLEEALRRDPRLPDAHYHLANVFQARRQFDRAIASYREALALRPDSIESQCNLGYCLHQRAGPGDLQEALEWLERAAAVRADSVPVLSNLSVVLQDLGRLEEARRCCLRAVELAPQTPLLHVNLGSVCRDLGELDAAIACYDRALALRTDDAAAQFQRGTALLARGDFAAGWAGYEYRGQLEQFDTPRHPQPRWDGAPLEGRTLLVQAEQGLGDTLQFIRYLPLVRQRGGRVVVAVQPALVPLLRSSGVENLVAADGPLPPFDVYAPLMSLPHILGTTLETIPHDMPYLAVEDERVARWREHLRQYEGFKVGVVWQGRTDHRKDRHRSIPLATLAPLARVPGVRLFSLQKNAGVEQLAALAVDSTAANHPEIVDLGALLDKDGPMFLDTGAVMRSLDLVITADTGLAHLAGALAVPVWVALDLGADWRWMIDREDSPWYPTMRLFRQNTPGDWDDVVCRLTAELRKLAGGPVS